LGYEKNSSATDNSGNSRYGHTEKTVSLENQSAVIQVSRNRNSAFEPEIILNHENRMLLFNDQIARSDRPGTGRGDRERAGMAEAAVGKEFRYRVSGWRTPLQVSSRGTAVIRASRWHQK
jgi:hypothetical protein